LPEGLEISKSKSLGLRFVKRLSKQLQGSFEYDGTKGSQFRVCFKDTLQRKQSD
jgi:two-component system, sensor histidine kinase PdtaS